jgi:O-antigen ligase
MSFIAQPAGSYAGTQTYEPKAPFLAQVRPWLLQGALMVCVTRGTIPFLQNGGEDAYGSGGSVSGTQIFILTTSVWLFGMLLTLGRRKSRSAMTDRVLLLSLPILAIVSTGWSVAPRMSAGMGFQLLLLTLLGLAIAETYNLEEQMQLFMITGLVAGGASLLAAVFSPATAFDHFGHTGALQGIFTHKNTCGSFMLFLFTPAVFLRRAGSHNVLKTFAYGLFCAMIVVLSQSVTSMLLLVFIALFTSAFGILKYFRNRDALFIAVALAALSIPILLLISANQVELTEWLGKDATFSGRTFIWQSILLFIAKKPWLGYGYMAFFSSKNAGAGEFSTVVGFSVNHAHNGFLMVWLDLGLVGLAIVTMILIRALSNLRRIWTRGFARMGEWYALIIVLVLLSNIDERGLASANDLTWLLFVVACAGLSRLARVEPAISSRREELPTQVSASASSRTASASLPSRRPALGAVLTTI